MNTRDNNVKRGISPRFLVHDRSQRFFWDFLAENVHLLLLPPTPTHYPTSFLGSGGELFAELRRDIWALLCLKTLFFTTSRYFWCDVCRFVKWRTHPQLARNSRKEIVVSQTPTQTSVDVFAQNWEFEFRVRLFEYHCTKRTTARYSGNMYVIQHISFLFLFVSWFAFAKIVRWEVICVWDWKHRPHWLVIRHLTDKYKKTVLSFVQSMTLLAASIRVRLWSTEIFVIYSDKHICWREVSMSQLPSIFGHDRRLEGCHCPRVAIREATRKTWTLRLIGSLIVLLCVTMRSNRERQGRREPIADPWIDLAAHFAILDCREGNVWCRRIWWQCVHLAIG